MPLLPHSDYRPPALLHNPHWQTVWASQFRRVGQPPYARERFETPDGDFFDVDWVRRGHSRLLILLHGLGGSARSRYMRGMARAAGRRGWDCAAVNFRGCSGEPNRLFRSYHSGATEDPRFLLERVLERGDYGTIAIAGFSLGANVTLKLLGELGADASPRLRAAVAFAAPTHLPSSAELMATPENRVYMLRFIQILHANIVAKDRRYPGRLPLPPRAFRRMRRFHEFDAAYTAPAHGFASAQDYWEKASSKPWLPRIRVPTLILNACDDPFLTPECHPRAEAEANPHLWLELTDYGGHVGWVTFGRGGHYWSELRGLAFLEEHCNGTGVPAP